MYQEIVSVEVPGWPWVSMKIWSKILKASMVRKMTATAITGASPGSVMAQNCCHQPSAVQRRRLVVLRVERCEPGQQDEEHEGRPLPDVRDQDGEERCPALGQPDDVDVAPQDERQEVIDCTVLAVPQETPAERGHDRGHHDRQHEERNEEAAPAEFIDDDQRQPQADEELQGNAHHHQQNGVEHGGVHARVEEPSSVVRQPDELIIVRVLQVTPLKAE